MAIQPEKRSIVDHLQEWWNGLEQLVDDTTNPDSRDRMERVLDYILLKIAKNDRLRTFVEEQDPDLTLLFVLNIEDRFKRCLHIFAGTRDHEACSSKMPMIRKAACAIHFSRSTLAL